MDMRDVRRTTDDSFAGALRMALGALFLMAGVMKLAVPLMAEAFSGQLVAAGIPMIWLAKWAVPLAEIGAGLALLVGAFTRIVALVIIGIMAVATYAHLVADDADLFPLQPIAPIVPLAVIAIAAYLAWRGGGSGSVHFKDGPGIG